MKNGKPTFRIRQIFLCILFLSASQPSSASLVHNATLSFDTHRTAKTPTQRSNFDGNIEGVAFELTENTGTVELEGHMIASGWNLSITLTPMIENAWLSNQASIDLVKANNLSLTPSLIECDYSKKSCTSLSNNGLETAKINGEQVYLNLEYMTYLMLTIVGLLLFWRIYRKKIISHPNSG